jgi:leucyl-tRNA synthetase
VPHLAEELWQALGHDRSLQLRGWPQAQTAAMEAATFTVVVQVNGKVRSRLTAPVTATDAVIKEMALTDPTIQKWLQGRPPQRVVLARRKLINLVI